MRRQKGYAAPDFPYSIALISFMPTIMPAELLTSRHHSSLVLTLSGSGAAALLQADIHAALIETLATAESDRSLSAIVLSGLEHFAPHEGKSAATVPSATAREYLNEWIDALFAFPKPVIAAVEGQLSGPGLPLMLACDLVVAGRNGSFRATPQLLGGLSWFLSRGLPRQFAMEMLLENQPLPAERLHAMGMINRLVDDGRARDSALEWADQLAQSANLTEGIKAVLQDARQHNLAQQLAAETQFHFEK